MTGTSAHGIDATARAPLGAAGPAVSRLGLGAGTQSNIDGSDALDGMLEQASQLGLNYIDTAPLYLAGESERRVGAFIARHDRSRFVLTTKVGRLADTADSAHVTGARRFDYSVAGTVASVEGSLARLGVEYLEGVVIHDLDRRMHGDDFERQYESAMTDCFGALESLRASGVIGSIGVSSRQPDVCLRVLGDAKVDFFMMAGSYTLLNHEPLVDLFAACERAAVSVVIASPFNTGILATGSADSMYEYAAPSPEILLRVQRLVEISHRHGVQLATAALQFPLLNPAVASIVVGHRSAAEVERNVSALRTHIPSAYWVELKQSGLIPLGAPTDTALTEARA